VKTAVLILVSVGSVGLIVTFVLMRRKLDELRKFREETRR
jgi:NADH:ubiquinone oxidoreductase subunit 6 (subunit J)